MTSWNALKRGAEAADTNMTDTHERRETRMRSIIGLPKDWNSLDSSTTRRLNFGRIDNIPLAYARTD
jgi:hypothetical protein